MKYLTIIIILLLCICSFQLSFAQAQPVQKQPSGEPYFWEPFVTWWVDATTWVLTGDYPPEAEDKPHPATQRIRRIDAYKHGYNPWFW